MSCHFLCWVNETNTQKVLHELWILWIEHIQLSQNFSLLEKCHLSLDITILIGFAKVLLYTCYRSKWSHGFWQTATMCSNPLSVLSQTRPSLSGLYMGWSLQRHWAISWRISLGMWFMLVLTQTSTSTLLVRPYPKFVIHMILCCQIKEREIYLNTALISRCQVAIMIDFQNHP